MNLFVITLVWILAIYGAIEILKNIIYYISRAKIKSNGIYLIIATKNQEENIEAFIRSALFRIVYGKEELLENVIITDLDSTDKTKEIIEKLSDEYTYLKVIKWGDCKELLDSIKNN